MRFAADDWPLIQPSEVQVELPPVHIAEPVLTPLGTVTFTCYDFYLLVSHRTCHYLLKLSTFKVRNNSYSLTSNAFLFKLFFNLWKLLCEPRTKLFILNLERVKRKDEEIRKNLEERKYLMADFLNIPRLEYDHIADMVMEESKTKEIALNSNESIIIYQELCKCFLWILTHLDV